MIMQHAKNQFKFAIFMHPLSQFVWCRDHQLADTRALFSLSHSFLTKKFPGGYLQLTAVLEHLYLGQGIRLAHLCWS